MDNCINSLNINHSKDGGVITGGNIFSEEEILEFFASKNITSAQVEALKECEIAGYPSEMLPSGICKALIDNRINVLYDLFKYRDFQNMRSMGKTKIEKIENLKVHVLLCAHHFIDYYAIKTIPEVNDSEPIELSLLLDKFVSDYIEHVVQNDKKKQNERNKQIYASFYQMCDEDDCVLLISKQHGITREMVRKLLVEFRHNMKELLDGACQNRRIVASDRIKEVLFYNAEEIGCFGYNKFIEKFGLQNLRPNQQNFVLYLWGLSVFIANNTCNNIQLVLEDSMPFGVANKCLKKALFYMRQVVTSVTIEQLQSEVMSEIESDKCFERDEKLILNMIYESGYFDIHSDDDRGETYVTLKWENLMYLNNEIARILWEEKRMIHREELLNLYNQRAVKYDMTKLELGNFNIKQTDLIECQPNGYWAFKEYGLFHVQPAEEFIHKFIVSEGGKVTLDQVYDAVVRKNYSNSKSTVRAYIVKYCRTCLNERDTFIHKEMLEDFPNVELRKEMSIGRTNDLLKKAVRYLCNKQGYRAPYNEIIKAIDDDNGKNIYSIFDGQDLFIREKDKLQNRFTHIRLNETIFNDVNFDINTLGVRKEPAYRQNIRSLSINYLKSVEGNKVALSVLFNRCKDLIPAGLSHNNVYKIFQNEDIFVKERASDGSRWFISLNESLLPAPKYAVQPQPENEPIVAKVLTPTDQIPSQPFFGSRQIYDWSRLRKEMMYQQKCTFDGISNFDIEKAVDSFYDLLSYRNDIYQYNWKGLLLQAINDFWLSKTDTYDLYAIYSILSTSFESFLKDIHYIHTGVDLSNKRVMLGETISLMSQMNDLKNFNWYVRPKGTFSKILDKLIKMRNNLSHRDNEFHQTFVEIIGNISEFIGLYLYVADMYKNILTPYDRIASYDSNELVEA